MLWQRSDGPLTVLGTEGRETGRDAASIAGRGGVIGAFACLPAKSASCLSSSAGAMELLSASDDVEISVIRSSDGQKSKVGKRGRMHA